MNIFLVLKNGSMNNVTNILVNVLDISAKDEIVQNMFGTFKIAFGSEEGANSSAMKIVAIRGKSQLKFVNFAVNVLTPNFRNGSVKSSLFFEFF